MIRRRKSVGDCTLLTLLLVWFVCRQANAYGVRWGVLFFLGSACVSPNWLAGLCRNTAKLSAELRSFEKSGQDVKGLFFSCLVDGCCVVIGLLATLEYMQLLLFPFYTIAKVAYSRPKWRGLYTTINCLGQLTHRPHAFRIYRSIFKFSAFI